MKSLIAVALCTLLAGCIVVPEAAYTDDAPVVGVVTFEPDVFVGGYYIGYYQPGFGYWTGYGWDINFYAFGHAGYGHYYRGAPDWAKKNYHARSGHGRVVHSNRHHQ